MINHLPAAVLVQPEAEQSRATREHLAACARCRVETRLLALADEGKVDETIQRSLDAHRETITGRVQHSIETIHHSSFHDNLVTEEDGDARPTVSARLSDYPRKRWLGAGIDATAHLAIDPTDETVCVVKIYHSSRRHTAPNQAQRARIMGLRHRNLGRLIAGGDGDAPFVVLERVDGPDMISWVRDTDATKSRHEVNLRRLRIAFQQVVSGLRALDEAGLAHGRLHPGNLRVDRTGRIVLLDHGLPGPDPLPRETPSFNPVVVYRAPEHREAGGASSRGDLYGLGIMMAEALNGERPRSATPFVDREEDIPADLRKLTTELLQDDPSSRPALTEVAARLGMDRMPAETPLERYDDLGILGTGGMGEVRRVVDRDLGRTMAMKIIRADFMDREGVRARFIEEAQCSAQLQHPGLVPVHELGRLPDGRLYFTMAEVQGRTLLEVVSEVHRAHRDGQWHRTETGWSFRGLIDAFARVCEAVAYAHSRGVLHRDLKPENVMVGDHGEVLVVDWGLAKVTGRPDRILATGELEPVVTDRSMDDAMTTRLGAISGTPSYMPPEQALGQIDQIDARSDVYALGAILYHLLSGRPPYQGETGLDILQQVLDGPPRPPGRPARMSATITLRLDLEEEAPQPADTLLPEELVAACTRAMQRSPADRFIHAGELATEINAWLEGARRRDQALEVVAQAEATGPRVADLRARAASLREEAAGLLHGVEGWQPEEDKAPGWDKEDEARALDRQADHLDLTQELLLAAALTQAPDLPEAHAALAARYRREHAIHEEAQGDTDRAESLLRMHASALPQSHSDRLGHMAYLSGIGTLTLETDPPGAEVELHRFESHHRRLVPVFDRSLGPSPIRDVEVAMGSYLCILRHPDRAEVRYPVQIGRSGHWSGVAPEGEKSHPIWLPGEDFLGSEECYVPAGWFTAGGDESALESLSRRVVWVDDFAITRLGVTNQDYISFLDDLVDQGREKEALDHAPRARGASAGAQGGLIYGYEGGHFSLQPDVDGDIWLPDWPVCMVSWHGATAYAQWSSQRTGKPWRLPHELEWEKAARGVDGRHYPWGDGFDPSWCHMNESHQNRRLPAEAGQIPVDESVYGARDMAGNIRDWTATAYLEEGDTQDGERVSTLESTEAFRVRRGGSWDGDSRNCRAGNRSRYVSEYRVDTLGLRLVRSIP